MTSKPIPKIMDTLISIVKHANELVMNIYNNTDSTNAANTSLKQDLSPLTQADLDSSNYICSELSSINDYPIICEETKLSDYSIRKEYTKFWLVDPLDGTKEFISRNGEFTVNIALIEKIGETFVPTKGIVSIPATGEIYYAEKGKGAYKLSPNKKPVRLICSPFTVKEPLNIICSRSHMNAATKDYFKQFTIKNTIMCGSSIKFMRICENEAQVYPRLQPCMEWDIGASDAIIREAGGQIQSLSGNVMKYNTPTLKINSLIAYGKHK
jgi:3'(2'), 5'-bisphosphate nucleotidase